MTHDEAVQSLAAERYLLDEMSELERHQFEEHFFACHECAESMRLGGRLRRDAAEVFPAVPVVTASSGWRGSRPAVVLPWAAAAVLAIALAYQASAPGQDGNATVALAPVALRPASRGEVPIVTVPDSGPVALALDVNMGAAGDEIAYTLSRDGGGEVANGRARTPAAGTPLVVLIPAGRLAGGGSFVLTLITGPGGVPSQYRFTVAGR